MRNNYHALKLLIMIMMMTPSVYSYDQTPLAPALYVFGDSLFDSGNNNLLPTLAKANFFPYGVNFAKGPTGRFTNGRTVADFIAEYLGLPLAPPYLSLSEVSVSGTNYASGSCGILPETGKSIGKCLSLGEQINLFQKTIQCLSSNFKNSAELSTYLSESLFAISVGSNDYLVNYLQPFPGTTKLLYSPQSFASLLVTSLSHHIQRLYEMGARKILLFDIGPLGCIPSIRRTYNHNGELCVEEINQLAILFNEEQDKMLKELRSTLQDAQFILGRVYGLVYDAILNPSLYGLVDTSNPCCTTWANGTSACIPELVPCLDTHRHFFWDGYHLTEAVYRIVGNLCTLGSSICTPKNIKELVE